MVEINGVEFPFADDKYHDPEWKPKVIGKRVRTYDGYEKVTGKAKFCNDIFLHNMLHAKILRSPIAHANIKEIDTSKAEALPGVKAVITYKDRTDVADLEGGAYSQRFLVNKVRQWGDPVAAVAAETEEIAEDALELIEVEYEELPVILEYDEALKPDAVIINEKLFPGNIALDNIWGWGDVEEGLKEADRIFEHDYSTHQPSMLQPELHCCVIKYEDGILYVWAPCQSLVQPRNQLARALNIPFNKIRVLTQHSGGGFGSSVKLGWYTPVAAILAMKTGRTVRLEKDIERETIQGGRCLLDAHVKVGVKNDGTLTAIDFTGHYNLGAYGYSLIISLAMTSTLNLYKCANVRYKAIAAITNRTSTTEYRGFGGPHAWPLEVLIDEICEEMGFDQLEFRKKNQYAQFDLCANGWTDQLCLLTSTGAVEMIDKLSEKMDWAAKWKPYKSKEPTTSPIKWGMGIGLGTRMVCLATSVMTARLNPDGTANTITGMGNSGCASHTTQAQVVAEVLELPIDKVTATWGDSFTAPGTTPSYCSLQAVNMSTASRHAAEHILQQLYERAAPLLGVSPDELEAKDGKIQVKGATEPEQAIPYADLVGNNECIIGHGENIPNISRYAGFGPSLISVFTQAGTCNEAEVDVETGGINVLRTINGMDIGRALNQNVVDGEVMGGGVTGIGEAVMCDIYFDSLTGVPLNTSHVDCMYPLTADIPEGEAVSVESIDPFTAFGTKGIGEISLCGPQPAIIDTIYNATGVRVREIPITPDVLLRALGKV